MPDGISNRTFVAVIIVLLFIATPIQAGFKKDCARKADRNSTDYRVFGSASKYSTGIGNVSGKRYGTSLSGVSRGIYGSSRNRAAYNINYQHCMSSYGG